MSTVNPRINVTITPDIAKIISNAAFEKKTSVSKIAADLIEWALEEREDIYYSKFANEFETKEHKWIENSDEIWK